MALSESDEGTFDRGRLDLSEFKTAFIEGSEMEDPSQDKSKNTTTNQDINGGTSSDNANVNNGRWTDEEHDKFVEAIKLYGKDWNLIEKYIGSRSCSQIRSHCQKFFSKLFKEGKTEVLEMFDNLLSGQVQFKSSSNEESV